MFLVYLYFSRQRTKTPWGFLFFLWTALKTDCANNPIRCAKCYNKMCKVNACQESFGHKLYQQIQQDDPQKNISISCSNSSVMVLVLLVFLVLCRKSLSSGLLCFFTFCLCLFPTFFLLHLFNYLISFLVFNRCVLTLVLVRCSALFILLILVYLFSVFLLLLDACWWDFSWMVGLSLFLLGLLRRILLFCVNLPVHKSWKLMFVLLTCLHLDELFLTKS